MADPEQMILVPLSSLMKTPNAGAAAERDVYFIQSVNGGLIKIGVATDVHARLKSIQATCPDRLRVLGLIRCLDHGKTEKILHKKFAALLSHGEWFRPDDALVGWISSQAETNTGRVRVCQRVLDLPPSTRRSRRDKEREAHIRRWL